MFPQCMQTYGIFYAFKVTYSTFNFNEDLNAVEAFLILSSC